MITTARSLFHRLRRAGVVLHANGDRLAFDAPTGAITAVLRDLMRSHKAELIAIVIGEYVPAALALVMAEPDADHRQALAEWFDERVAIGEYGGLSAGDAQREVYIQLARRVESRDRGAETAEVSA